MKNGRNKRGVTLVEIAIVLVIIGLLLGGILKGQELINNAKVRSIADRQNSLKVAWFAFIDRYQALPGDFVRAKQFIPGAVGVATVATLGDGTITVDEAPLVLQNLTGAGYLRCPQCNAVAAGAPTAANSLQNSYGGIMAIFSDKQYYAAVGGPMNRPRLQIHTGPRIPSNILSEVDRKLDDGTPNTGDVVFNEYDASEGGVGVGGFLHGTVNTAADLCTSALGTTQGAGLLTNGAPNFWRLATGTPPVEQNCGASVAI